jgi:hypothetical protein
MTQMRRVAGVLGATALVGGLVATVASSAGTASTATPSGSDSTAESAEPPWEPVPEEDFIVPATFCGFEVDAHILKVEEFAKTVTTFPNGNPQTQLFKGPLFIRFTNAETGKSIDRNASGNAFETFGVDGSLKSLAIRDNGSHFVTRMPPGSNPGPGIFLVSGEWSTLLIDDDGTRSLLLGPDGSAENLCEPLSS